MLFHYCLVKLTISSCRNVPATFCWLAFPVSGWDREPVFSQEEQIQLAVLLKDWVFSASCGSPCPFPVMRGAGRVWPQLPVPKLARVRQQEHGTKSTGEEWAEEWTFSFSKGNTFGSSPAWKWLLETGWNNYRFSVYNLLILNQWHQASALLPSYWFDSAEEEPLSLKIKIAKDKCTWVSISFSYFNWLLGLLNSRSSLKNKIFLE